MAVPSTTMGPSCLCPQLTETSKGPGWPLPTATCVCVCLWPVLGSVKRWHLRWAQSHSLPKPTGFLPPSELSRPGLDPDWHQGRKQATSVPCTKPDAHSETPYSETLYHRAGPVGQSAFARRVPRPGPQASGGGASAPGTPALSRQARNCVCQEPGPCQAALPSKTHLDPAGDLGPGERNPATSSVKGAGDR